jgi:hypothetical protein
MTDRMTDERLAFLTDAAETGMGPSHAAELLAECKRARAEEAAQRHRAWTLEQHLDKVRADTIEEAAQCAEDFRCEDWPRCYSGECAQLTLAAAAIRDLAGKGGA